MHVVTGASGLVGAALVRELIAKGIPVRALYRSDPRPLEGLALEMVRVDVLSPSALRDAFRGAEVVYHSAAHVSIDWRDEATTNRINVVGTRNVIAACRDVRVPTLVHVSTSHCLVQEPLELPLREDRALLRRGSDHGSAYELSKADAERHVLEAASPRMRAVSVNPTGVLGPFDYKPSKSFQLLIDLADGKLPALFPGGHDWVDSRDVARGAIAAAERGRSGERYLLGGEYATLAELAARVSSLTKVPAPRFVVPMGLTKIGATMAEWWCNATNQQMLFNHQALKVLEAKNPIVCYDKARTELGYDPRPLATTLEDTIRWGGRIAAKK